MGIRSLVKIIPVKTKKFKDTRMTSKGKTGGTTVPPIVPPRINFNNIVSEVLGLNKLELTNALMLIILLASIKPKWSEKKWDDSQYKSFLQSMMEDFLGKYNNNQSDAREVNSNNSKFELRVERLTNQLYSLVDKNFQEYNQRKMGFNLFSTSNKEPAVIEFLKEDLLATLKLDYAKEIMDHINNTLENNFMNSAIFIQYFKLYYELAFKHEFLIGGRPHTGNFMHFTWIILDRYIQNIETAKNFFSKVLSLLDTINKKIKDDELNSKGWDDEKSKITLEWVRDSLDILTQRFNSLISILQDSNSKKIDENIKSIFDLIFEIISNRNIYNFEKNQKEIYSLIIMLLRTIINNYSEVEYNFFDSILDKINGGQKLFELSNKQMQDQLIEYLFSLAGKIIKEDERNNAIKAMKQLKMDDKQCKLYANLNELITCQKVVQKNDIQLVNENNELLSLKN